MMSNVTRKDVLTNARWAGQVQRYHTWPVHHHQSVGEHTWQIMRIYWQIWGPLPPDVSTAILWHDTGELVTGDLPFPMKRQNPDLKEKFIKLEAEATFKMGMHHPPEISQEETIRVVVCDLIEMFEFGIVELRFGNDFAEPIVDDIGATIRATVYKLSLEDQDKVYNYLKRWPHESDPRS